MSRRQKKVLIVRLSSLGDLILASSVLESPPVRLEVSSGTLLLDWLVAEEFKSLLEGHPRLNQIVGFRRKAGLLAWIRLSKRLWEAGYDEVLDLHLSLRTRIMRFGFMIWDFSSGRTTLWRGVCKERGRLWAYFLLKRKLPRRFLPAHWISKFVRVWGGVLQTPDALERLPRPNFSHLQNSAEPKLPDEFFCVMPSSNWKGKNWPVAKYLELLQSSRALPVILGTPKDEASLQLIDLLQKAKVAHLSGIGKWSLPELGAVLKKSRGLISGDTGLVHLAQALEVPAVAIFGPTTPEMGFGPWNPSTVSVGSDLWCRPCSKDGRGCFRLLNPYQCLERVTVDQVAQAASRILNATD